MRAFLAFAIDPEQLWQTYGSDDRLLLEYLLSDRGADLRGALTAYIAGAPPPPASPHQNLGVVALLTAVLGTQLASHGWDRTDADFIAAVSAALGRRGIRLPLWDLFHRWPPDRVPARSRHHAGDTTLGFLDPEQVAAAAPALDAVELPESVGGPVTAAVDDLRRW